VKQEEKYKSEISIKSGTGLCKTALSDTLSSGTFLPISTFYFIRSITCITSRHVEIRVLLRWYLFPDETKNMEKRLQTQVMTVHEMPFTYSKMHIPIHVP